MIWSAAVIGFLGSLHCIGMCGPLALAVPVVGGNRLLSAISYNVGRILTYGVLGAAFGFFGMGLHLAGYQSYLSIFAGIFILIWVVHRPFSHWLAKKSGLTFDGMIRSQVSKRLKNATFRSVFLIGMFNGLLPCGLIYIAIVAALETGYIELAAAYMMLFGVGTAIPLLIAMLSKPLFTRFKLLRKPWVIPSFSVVLALMFIIRGVIYMLPPEAHQSTLVDILATITLCKTGP